MPIVRWADLDSENYQTAIVGNGLSVAVHEQFAYESLLGVAAAQDLIDAQLQKVFEHLRTQDFEFVLKMLWHTREINRALTIESIQAEAAYQHVRYALIEAVRSIHVDHAAVEPQLINLADFLQQFETVISLTYDLLVYWAIMAENNQLGGSWFKDCFVHGNFQFDWEYLREPVDNLDGSTLVFYPHGNLALAENLNGHEVKREAPNTGSLIDVLGSDEYSPLFVSEGTSDQKLVAIGRSRYLSQIYSGVLGDVRGGVAVFGWAMSANDQHILNALPRDEIQSMAIAIHQPDQAGDQKCAQYREIIDQHFPNGVDLRFFDADSVAFSAELEN